MFAIGRPAACDDVSRPPRSRSLRKSKNWIISRHGSQLNMLRDAATFDISFKQFGQSGFMGDIEILC